MSEFRKGQELIYNGHLATVDKLYDNKIDLLLQPEYKDEPALQITINKDDLHLSQLNTKLSYANILCEN